MGRVTVAKKKKKKGGAGSNRMTSAERTRAKMRAQELSQAERREKAAQQPDRREQAPLDVVDASAEMEDIDAQIAALQRKKAQLEGGQERAGQSRIKEDAADVKKSGDDSAFSGPASSPARTERKRPQAYPGEDKLRQAQSKLEKRAAVWDSNPTVNRVVCALIDFFVGGVCLMGPACLPYYYLSGSASLSSLTDYVTIGQPAWLAILLACVGLVLGLFYYVVVPWKIWPGQTLGKHLGHIQIVRRDRRPLDIGTILLRQVVGVMFLELGLTCNLLLVPQLITLVTGSADAGTSFQSVGLAITVVSIIMFFSSKKRLPLHDRFAGTRVVQV